MVSPFRGYEPPEGRQRSSDDIRHIRTVTDRTLVVLIGHDLNRLIREVHVLDDGLGHVALLEQAAIKIEPIASLQLGIRHTASGVIVIRPGWPDIETPDQPRPPLHMARWMCCKVAVILGLEHGGTFEVKRPLNDVEDAHLGWSRRP